MSSPQATMTPTSGGFAAGSPVAKRIALAVGMLIVVALTFGRVPGLSILVQAAINHEWFPSPFLSDLAKLGLGLLLAAVAFGIARRKPSFFGMRRIRKQDVIDMLKTLAVLYATIIVLKLLQENLMPGGATPATPISADDEELPLLYALAGALIAGVTEEFVYRAYLIEELGELSRNRILAGAVSVIMFGLAHVGSGYGWSVDLLYPVLYGVALTVLYLRTRSLWVCVLMHCAQDVLYVLVRAW